jgi:hypothetical protein
VRHRPGCVAAAGRPEMAGLPPEAAGASGASAHAE